MYFTGKNNSLALNLNCHQKSLLLISINKTFQLGVKSISDKRGTGKSSWGENSIFNEIEKYG